MSVRYLSLIVNPPVFLSDSQRKNQQDLSGKLLFHTGFIIAYTVVFCQFAVMHSQCAELSCCFYRPEQLQALR